MPDSHMLDRLFGELATADLPVRPPATVVARGRQRRRRARARTITAVVAVAVITVGVTQFTRNREAPATVGQHTQSAVCAAAPDAALNAELRHTLPASQQQSVSVIAVSPNGAVLYLLTTEGAFHGVATESVATGAISLKISPFAVTPFNDVAGGLGPNGEVVWSGGSPVNPVGSLVNVSELWSNPIVWSPRPLPSWMARMNIGQSVPLGIVNQDAETLSAPVFSGRFNQLVAWEAPGAVYDSPTRKIVEADLLTGVTEVVASGYVGAPIFAGNTLVWPVANRAGGPYHLVAASASTRQPVAVPLQLRKAGAATDLVSSGGATAYASTDRTKVFYSPSLSQPARQVLALPPGSELAPGERPAGGPTPGGLAVGPGYLAWNTSAGASYVASTKTLAATRITDGTATRGAVQGLDDYVLASRSTQPESGNSSLYLLNGSVIAGLTCARHGRASG
jgi:hypothetical protein